MGVLNAIDQAVAPLARELQLRQRRHAAIAANIANADTPGYRAVDVPFDRALERAGLRMAVTHPRHRPGAAARPGTDQVVLSGGVPRKDGNDVDVDQEMAKLARNQIEYRFLTRMLGNRFRKYREAITGRSTP